MKVSKKVKVQVINEESGELVREVEATIERTSEISWSLIFPEVLTVQPGEVVQYDFTLDLSEVEV